jgi:DNA modification methylase
VVTDVSLENFFADLHLQTDNKGLTHRLHPYPAKFIPQIPRQLIAAFSSPGDVVLDPMCGSGTTAVEAIVSGRRAIAIDINPISALVTRAKTTPLLQADREVLFAVADAVENGYVPENVEVPAFHNRDHWFSPDAIGALAAIRGILRELPSGAAATLATAALSAIIVGVSRQESETRWARVEKDVSDREVRRRFSRHLREDIASNVILAAQDPATAEVVQGDARDLPVPDGAVDLVVTSPPYANSHDYYLYHKLRMFWLDYDVRATQEREFGSRNKHSDKKLEMDHYLEAMSGVFSETSRVLKLSGRACFVVGDAVIRGRFYDMGDILPAIAESAGLRTERLFRFDQQKFTRAFTRGFGTALPKRTHVLVLSKES